MNRRELFISLMIGIGSPFMALIMGIVDQKTLAGIGLIYVVALNVSSSVKVIKDNYISALESLVAMNLVIPIFSFLLGGSDSLSLVLKISMMIVFTLINCIGLSIPVIEYVENEIRWRFEENE